MDKMIRVDSKDYEMVEKIAKRERRSRKVIVSEAIRNLAIAKKLR